MIVWTARELIDKPTQEVLLGLLVLAILAFLLLYGRKR